MSPADFNLFLLKTPFKLYYFTKMLFEDSMVTTYGNQRVFHGVVNFCLSEN